MSLGEYIGGETVCIEDGVIYLHFARFSKLRLVI